MRLTLDEVGKVCDWEKFCDKKGIDLYARKEGFGDSTIELSITEARELGILKSKEDW